ncbi:MAG: zinc metalloprotease [Ponticaulis sp.]|nr:zinc metalloprotease [Ponticaulis sp.]
MKHLLMAASAIALLGVSACSPSSETTTTTETSATPSPTPTTASMPEGQPEFGSFGIDLDVVDESVEPGDDFNKYVNGKWLASFEIPSDRTRFGVFDMLAEKAENQVKSIIETTAEAAPPAGTLEGKIAAFYNTYMDVDTINAKGIEPAQPYLDRIAAIDSREELADVFASTGFSAPFGGWVDVDAKQTDEYIFYITQAGLGLPDRDYYLKDTADFIAKREAYQAFLETMLELAGYEDPAAGAQMVYDLEAQIAEAHWDRAVGRNRNLTYNKLSRDELVELGGGFPVQAALDGLGIGDQEYFVVRQVAPTAEELEESGLSEEDIEQLGAGVAGLFEIAQNGDMDAWKAYLTAHFLMDHADVLPSEIDDARFDFYGKTLGGQPEQRVRWKRAVDATEGALGEAVGKVYVDEHFQPAAKAAMVDLVENLRKAMRQNLEGLEWMGDDTKVEAYDKLAKFTPKIGYPDKFETYDDLTITPGEAFANEIAVADWQYADMISQLGQPIDKTEWFMFPQTVNAYYSPTRNEIVFPAAILQPPFFDLYADPAVNYGAIGAVIGHEMGHGFDDQGSKSDGDGLLRNWWTDEDDAAFKERTQALVAQYNEFCPIENSEDDTVCVNGRLTLGENIGDLGGLSMAYTAYKLSLNGEEAPVIDGVTGDQRFFMSWAQVWRALYREERLRTQLATDPHSPPMYRINGIVRNMDAWYEAFGVTEDNALYVPPAQRISIW